MKKLLLLVVAAVSFGAFAVDTVNAHLFRFSDTLETVQVEDALGANSELAQYKWLLRFHYDYTYNPFFGKVDKNDPNTSISSVSAGAAFMLSKRFLLGFDFPYHLDIRNANDEDGLGDIRIKAKWRLTGDNAGINFALIPFLTLGTGDDDFAVTDGLGGGLKLALDKAFGKFKVFANLGAALHSDAKIDPVSATEVNRKSVVEGALGIFWAFSKPVGLNLEWVGQKSISGHNDYASPFVVRGGLRGNFGRVKPFLGASVETGRESYHEQEYSVYAGLKFGLGTAVKPVPVAAPVVVEAPAKPDVEVLKQDLSVSREINFKSGSATILDSSYPELDSAAAIISKYQDYIGNIVIEGHTDSVGKASSNKALSQKRADAVKAYLVSKGINASKLEAVGYGEERLKVSPETSKADRAMNRRVEFIVNETIEIEEVVE